MVRSFRPRYEQLTDDPIRRIRQSITLNAPVHLLTACALVPSKQRREAVDILVEEVRGDRRIDWAMFAGLQHLCATELGRDASAWKAWWPRVRETYFEEPKRRGSDVPTFDAD